MTPGSAPGVGALTVYSLLWIVAAPGYYTLARVSSSDVDRARASGTQD